MTNDIYESNAKKRLLRGESYLQRFSYIAVSLFRHEYFRFLVMDVCTCREAIFG